MSPDSTPRLRGQPHRDAVPAKGHARCPHLPPVQWYLILIPRLAVEIGYLILIPRLAVARSVLSSTDSIDLRQRKDSPALASNSPAECGRSGMIRCASSRTPSEPSGCYPSPARRRPALLLSKQGAGTQGITPLSGPPPSAHNGERGGGVTP